MSEDEALTRDYRKIKRIIAANVRHYRKKLGLTQAEVSEKAGITNSFWQRVELDSQKEIPSMLYLVKIARALGVEPHQLLRPRSSKR